MRRTEIPFICALALALSFSLPNTMIYAEEQGEIAIVARTGTIAWLTAMQDGIKEAGKEQNGAGLV